mmetsp:Transcript_48640/g.35815  ORF Transcript_48640/g.35815 Transcript_48640/m.35815 type:complete len:88 (+) Transcript_48640:311-574(+)
MPHCSLTEEDSCTTEGSCCAQRKLTYVDREVIHEEASCLPEEMFPAQFNFPTKYPASTLNVTMSCHDYSGAVQLIAGALLFLTAFLT